MFPSLEVWYEEWGLDFGSYCFEFSVGTQPHCHCAANVLLATAAVSGGKEHKEAVAHVLLRTQEGGVFSLKNKRCRGFIPLIKLSIVTHLTHSLAARRREPHGALCKVTPTS